MKKKKAASYSKLMQTGTIIGVCIAIVGIVYVVAHFFISPTQKYVDVRVGQSVVLNFTGNESVSLRWRLNKTKSTQLRNVDVRMIGWTYPEQQKARNPNSAFGARRTSRFEVHAKEAGISKLTFEFKKRGSSDAERPIRTRIYNVRVSN